MANKIKTITTADFMFGNKPSQAATIKLWSTAIKESQSENIVEAIGRRMKVFDSVSPQFIGPDASIFLAAAAVTRAIETLIIFDGIGPVSLVARLAQSSGPALQVCDSGTSSQFNYKHFSYYSLFKIGDMMHLSTEIDGQRAGLMGLMTLASLPFLLPHIKSGKANLASEVRHPLSALDLYGTPAGLTLWCQLNGIEMV